MDLNSSSESEPEPEPPAPAPEEQVPAEPEPAPDSDSSIEVFDEAPGPAAPSTSDAPDAHSPPAEYSTVRLRLLGIDTPAEAPEKAPEMAGVALSGLTVSRILGFKPFKARPGSLEGVLVRLQFSDGRSTGQGLVDSQPLLQTHQGVAMLTEYAKKNRDFAPYLPPVAAGDGAAEAVGQPPADPWIHLLPRLGAVQCAKCAKWRLLPEADAQAAETDTAWECASSPDRRFSRCETPQQMPDDQMDMLLALQPARPEARGPSADEERERLGLPAEANFSRRATIEARVQAEHAAGRYAGMQNKLPPPMRAAGWFIVPEGGDGAYKEGHYAYFMPEPEGCGDKLPYFRNTEAAIGWWEQHRGGGGGGGGGRRGKRAAEIKPLAKGISSPRAAQPPPTLRRWVQCEEPSCQKWRVLQEHATQADLRGWTCERQYPFRHDLPQEELLDDEEEEASSPPSARRPAKAKAGSWRQQRSASLEEDNECKNCGAVWPAGSTSYNSLATYKTYCKQGRACLTRAAYQRATGYTAEDEGELEHDALARRRKRGAPEEPDGQEDALSCAVGTPMLVD